MYFYTCLPTSSDVFALQLRQIVSTMSTLIVAFVCAALILYIVFELQSFETHCGGFQVFPLVFLGDPREGVPSWYRENAHGSCPPTSLPVSQDVPPARLATYSDYVVAMKKCQETLRKVGSAQEESYACLSRSKHAFFSKA